ncbi:MAG TPA: DNA-formamidopyrimidine glycosylase family protein [Marmoricola sp.]|nr:DNA-formamidopyrimidine glycosylase family protein [Marmoricola sp.]
MPELPEVAALATDLRQRLDGRAIARIDIANFSCLKTYDPPITALHGGFVDNVGRHGKFLDIEASGVHLIIHLARAGWIRWMDDAPKLPARPNSKSALAARILLDNNAAINITEAGTKKSLALYVVRDPADVPGIAALGPDPLADAFTKDVLHKILEANGRAQIKGVLRMQSNIAGIGNAYSDEILHAAHMSPFKPANSLSPEELDELYSALRGTLEDAVARSEGMAATELKGEKKRSMSVHGRTGQACPVCGDVVREVSFADSSLQYCATCQTGGKPLADRRMSKLLK